MFNKIIFYIIYVLLLAAATLAGLEVLIRLHCIPELPYYNSDGWWRELYLNGHQSFFTDKPLAQYHPILGWDLRNNIDNLKINDWTVNTNNIGLRGKRPTTLQKLKAKRAIVMGDSMTFGQCVNDDQAYPAQLDQLRNDYEVLNLGVPGYGFDQQLLKLKLMGLSLNPDVVIQSFFQPDMERDATSFRDYVKPRFIIKDGRLQIINVPIEDPKHFLKSFKLRILNYWQILYDRLHHDSIFNDDLHVTLLILREILIETQQAGAKMVFVYLPTSESLLSNAPTNLIFAKICDEDSGLICVDPTQRLREYLSTLAKPEDELKCHYSPRLQQIVAEEVSRVLK